MAWIPRPEYSRYHIGEVGKKMSDKLTDDVLEAIAKMFAEHAADNAQATGNSEFAERVGLLLWRLLSRPPWVSVVEWEEETYYIAYAMRNLPLTVCGKSLAPVDTRGGLLPRMNRFGGRSKRGEMK